MRRMAAPRLFTFDIFGTVIDWRRGMSESLQALGRPFERREFDAVVDAQGADEQAEFRLYRDITARSLVRVLGLQEADAAKIGASVGTWPPFSDSAEALRKLMKVAPCVATTNSDAAHGEQAQEGLGLRLSGWYCAELTRRYKPSPDVWAHVGRELGVQPGPSWWHVSAYADYDLKPAKRLGLTTVFVRRPHSRPGTADLSVRDLSELAELVSRVL
jgi:2-haloalkanoic acid dehalogenase type II